MKEAFELLEEVTNPEQLELLKTLGYFTAPASTKFHLPFTGGLAEHSVNVTMMMLKMDEDLNLGMKREWIIQSGMFHDIEKVGYYEENMLKGGNQSDKIPYKYKPRIILPHGPGALYLLCNELNLKLDVPVASAISFHSGAFDEVFRKNVGLLAQQPVEIILWWLLHSADMYCSYIKEPQLQI